MHDVDPAQRLPIVRVLDSVLASGLRSWVAGRVTVNEVNDRLSEAIRLLLR